MRSSRELLLASRAFACESRARSWWHLGTTVAATAALAGAALADVAWPARLLAGILLGLVLVRFFVLYHDFQHGAVLRGSWLARAILHTFGMVMLNPPSSWKRSHDHHHAHNTSTFGRNVGSFTILTVDGYQNASPWQKRMYAAERHPLTIILGYVSVFLIGMCVIPLLANPRRHWDAGLSILCHAVFLGLLLWWGVDALVFAALVPCSVASAMGAYLFYAQHNFPGVQIRVGQDWNHVSAALTSSSYIKMGPFLQWCTANIGYHHVHHLNSQIPFYRLPEAMAALEELQSPVTLTLSPRDIWRCARLKLWDPARGELVPWPDAVKTPMAEPAEVRPSKPFLRRTRTTHGANR